MIKRIDIGGIERQLSVSNMADGSMYELRGMTHRGGNLRPQSGLERVIFGATQSSVLATAEKLLYVHKYEDYEHYIISSPSGLYYLTANGRYNLYSGVASVLHVTSMGNMLIAMCEMSAIPGRQGVCVWLYQKGKYGLISESSLPYIGITKATSDEYKFTSESIDIIPDMDLKDFNTTPTPTYITERSLRMQLTEQYSSLIANLREIASEENIFVDSYFVRYGLRMYDGNYLHVSPPVLIKGNDYSLLCDSAVYNTDGFRKFEGCRVEGKGYKLYADFSNIDDSLFENNIVTHIDFFISEAIREYDEKRMIDSKVLLVGTEYPGGGDIEFSSLSPRNSEDIESYFSFYRVWSVASESAKTDSVEIDAKNKLGYIVQLPLLKNESSIHQYGAESIFTYNGRLHIGGLREYLFGGYPLSYMTYSKGEGGSTMEEVTAFVYLRDNGKEYVVKSKTVTVRGKLLSAYVCYPDSRAYKMVILSIAPRSSGFYKRTLLLKEHPFANESYYFEGYDADGISVMRDEDDIASDDYTAFMATLPNDVVYRPDVVKVSELHNPMVFENAKTYTVGNGKIVAMASATKAMSTGQFGQYPLYVFASDGIYAMLSGGGDVLYSHVAPVNHHIVENARTVCPVDEAVVFGTRQGLFILAGGDAVNISTPLDEHGLPMIENDRNLEHLVRNVCGEDIYGLMLRERIAEGGVVYHYANREILLYDKSGDCKIYSIDNKKWYSSAYDVSYAVASYPELYVVNDTNVYTIKDIPSGDATSSLLLVTNPMQLSDAMNAKRAARIHLVSHLCGASDESFVDVGIGVSNDGEEYALAYRKELRVGKVHNLTIPHGMSGYRYMVIVVFGYGMDARSYINSIEVEFDEVRKER